MAEYPLCWPLSCHSETQTIEIWDTVTPNVHFGLFVDLNKSYLAGKHELLT